MKKYTINEIDEIRAKAIYNYDQINNESEEWEDYGNKEDYIHIAEAIRKADEKAGILIPTLEEFLLKHDARKELFEFAKDLTLWEFVNSCQRGDWILWLFSRTNPKDLHLLTLVKGLCANTARHLMCEQRIKAIDTAIAFGNGKVSKEVLDSVSAYDCGASTAACETALAAAKAYALVRDYVDISSHNITSTTVYTAAEVVNQKETADICRKYLPAPIWNRIQ